jgi:hypothetical protein
VSIVGNRLDRLELTSMARSFAWVAATVVGLGVGGFVFHFPGSFGETSWQPAAIIFGAVLGGINGLLVGLLQGLALGWMRISGSRLMLAMGIGIGASHGLADGVPLAIGLGTVVLAGSAVLTLAFRTVMGVRDRASLTAIFLAWAAGWLVAVQIAGWLGLPREETPIGWATAHAVIGLITGLAWGVVTAIVGLPTQLHHLTTASSTVTVAPTSPI